MSFAKPLKDVARKIYDLSDEQVNGDLKEETDPRYGITPRFILQKLGTEGFRNIRQSTWTDYWAREYRNNYDPTELVLVTDVRFPDELEAIKREGGVIWKLVRDGGPGARGGIGGHASEAVQRAIPDTTFDTIIVAKSGDLEGLVNSAFQAYQKLAITLTEPIK